MPNHTQRSICVSRHNEYCMIVWLYCIVWLVNGIEIITRTFLFAVLFESRSKFLLRTSLYSSAGDYLYVGKTDSRLRQNSDLLTVSGRRTPIMFSSFPEQLGVWMLYAPWHFFCCVSRGIKNPKPLSFRNVMFLEMNSENQEISFQGRPKVIWGPKQNLIGGLCCSERQRH